MILCDDNNSDENEWIITHNIIKIIGEILFASGQWLDIRFINRSDEKCFNIEQIDKIFKIRPSGVSPIIDRIKQIYNETKELEKQILFLILINDHGGGHGVDHRVDHGGDDKLNRLIIKKPNNFIVNIQTISNKVDINDVELLNDHVLKYFYKTFTIIDPPKVKNKKKCIIT